MLPIWNSLSGEVVPNQNKSDTHPTLTTTTTSTTNTAYSIGTIRRMMESKQWIEKEDINDSNSTTTKQLYHLHIPIDTLTVLKALEQLMKPDPNLYDVPFVIATLDTDTDTGTANDTTTAILRPLVQSPDMGPIVFGKDPTTRVVVDMNENENRNEVVVDVVDDHDAIANGDEEETEQNIIALVVTKTKKAKEECSSSKSKMV